MPTTTTYIWDEQNYLAETDGSNVVQTVYTNEPEQYGNLVSSRISGATSYHHFDAIGSTRQLTNAAGTITDTMVYDGWGNAVNRSGTTGVRLLWIGQFEYYFDPETGMIVAGSRTYGPSVARWTAVDPAGFVDGLNLCRYVRNSPLLLVDPSGLRIYVEAFEGAGGEVKMGKILDPEFRPIAEEFSSYVVWNFHWNWRIRLPFLPPIWTFIADDIAQRAMMPDPDVSLCFPRIVIIGHSWGGRTAYKVVEYLAKKYPELKIDAVLTIDPVFDPSHRHDKEGKADKFDNYCEWTSFFQTTDTETLGYGVLGDDIIGVSNKELKDLGANAHVDIVRDARPKEKFRAILHKLSTRVPPGRKTWRDKCPVPDCDEC